MNTCFSHASAGIRAGLGLLLCELLTFPGLPADHVIGCTETELTTAVGEGGRIFFDCDGTIVLTQTIQVTTNVWIDARGRTVAVSGDDKVRVFKVNGGASLTIDSLTITRGYSSEGAAIHNLGGWVMLTNATIVSNTAAGGLAGDGLSGLPAFGGAAYNEGTLIVQGGRFVANAARGGDGAGQPGDCGGGAPGEGGAICGVAGTISLAGTLFEENTAQGGNGGYDPATLAGCGGGGASGGAIHVEGGTLGIVDCCFSNNSAVGGHGARYAYGGSALGGSLRAATNETVICSTRFEQNQCRGGVHAMGAGGAIYANDGTLSLRDSTFVANRAFGGSGDYYRSPGVASGGALHLGSGVGLTTFGEICGCTFYTNHSVGGSSGSSPYVWKGGDGFGGAIGNRGVLKLVNTTLFANEAAGGEGSGPFYPPPPDPGAGGDGFGGALYSQGAVSLTNATLAGNVAIGGPGGSLEPLPPGATGDAFGGGICIGSGSVTLKNTIVAGSLSGSNFFGMPIDAGNNLSSDASGGFTEPTSLINTDPILGPLTDNAGPTWTLALLPGSPAIDAGEIVIGLDADQRGFSRNTGVTTDVGAYESHQALRFLSIARTGDSGVIFRLLMEPGVCHIEAATTLDVWEEILAQTNNSALVQVTNDTADLPVRLYRAWQPED